MFLRDKLTLILLCHLFITCTQASELSCNASILGFLDMGKATLTVPQSVDKQRVKAAHVIVYFRESHGGYQSCFSLKEADTDKKIPLFCEVQWSDNPIELRGGNDWLGTPEGGVLGDAPSIKMVKLEIGKTYNMLLHGDSPSHNIIANSVRTNVNDPIIDNDPDLFTFYEESQLGKVKTLGFKHPQPGVSTIMGFEDEYLPESEKDYNDIIIEMCLQLEFEKSK